MRYVQGMKPTTHIIARSARKAARKASADDARWTAVLARDASADGSFVLGVKTTGIYCRPSCPARKPLRQNVSFYASCAEAEAAGFRACKRCKPNEAGAGDSHADKIAAACRMIETADAAPSLDKLAARAGLSPHHFHRIFKATTGLTPKAYAVAHRNKRVREALKGGRSVTDAIYEAGFNSSGRFYDGAQRALGMKPGTYRAGGAGMQIRYAIAPCSLGLVIAAVTDAGVCAIFLGEDGTTLKQELAARFPNAERIEARKGLEKVLADVVASIDTPAKAPALPLDIRGTAFQQRVWAALQEIPAGETTTYAEIARRIGKPKAVRAVGAACGANPVAVAVPCHRVVGQDGKLTGYRWGVARKRALLERERK